MNLDLQGIFDALLEGVVVLDDDGRVEFSNGEARRLLDTALEGSAGKHLADTLGPEHPLSRIVERVRQSGRPAIHDEVEFPRARVEIEDEQVVSVNRPVVTSEDVERVAMHRS